MKVAILLSTYNGAEHLKVQIESILNQSYTNFSLYIRDDGSSDNTPEIIRKFCEMDKRVNIVPSIKNLGCANSFLTMAKNIESDIYMFCDQDDFWLKDKVQRAIASFTINDNVTPLLYHTDLKIVDEKLKIICDSFYKQQELTAINSNTKNNIFIQNYVVGCTIAINQALHNILFNGNSIPVNVAMHDWWLALIAKCFGHIHFDSTQTLLYRQHSSNVIGAKKKNILEQFKSLFCGSGLLNMNKYRLKVSRQAKSFIHLYESTLTTDELNKLTLVSKIGEGCSLIDLYSLYKSGVVMQSKRLNIALIYSILFDSKLKFSS